MSLVFYAGIALALAGLAGIFWFIMRARRLKRVEINDAAIQIEFRALAALNVASVGLAFLGLAVAIVGLILS